MSPGSSTADRHVPVLLDEVLAALAPEPAGTYVDATFGRGGHSRALLARLGAHGRLLALDRDPDAARAAAAVDDARFRFVRAPFSELAQVAANLGIAEVAGILFDLGVSSPQLDTPERGLSFRHAAALDMRMDPTTGETAAAWLNRAEVREIAKVLREFGEERLAHAIAKAIVAARASEPVLTTTQLAALVAQVVRRREAGQHPATRSFQAIRIFINRELEELALALPQAVSLLRPGGRLAVISFHSLEDRIVKRFIRGEAAPDTLPRDLPIRAEQLPRPRLRALGRPVHPGEHEIARNPRARSAVLRVAEKLA
ncbi:MAG: Ribosomal RNA small subunit methyltransferase H [Rhodocyclaceae bacterium]|nr:16S rRNA (cytosine(1402)-N(4))-methyltransferase RsmH [Rhodocyclaceae bacterium]MCG3185935.1 Ribosomal RNA small subunit methyltransferase H [Rhodocyclaceae bacterium]